MPWTPPKRTDSWQLRITLLVSNPPIWRRLLVPGDVTLGHLHWIFQTAMGWKDCHVHLFIVDKIWYGVPNPEYEWDVKDEELILLSRIAPRAGFQFNYEYDMGDDWVHAIEVEAITRPEKPLRYATCLGGARACPPEDSGGMDGYEEILRILRNPRHEEYMDTRSWAGRGFKSEAFDSKRVNAKLKLRPRLVR